MWRVSIEENPLGKVEAQNFGHLLIVEVFVLPTGKINVSHYNYINQREQLEEQENCKVDGGGDMHGS
jgi:hypothetical protein